MRLEVHAKSDCPWCQEAKAFLKQHRIAYTVVMHDDDEERQRFYDSLGLKEERTVPQVLLHDDDGQVHRIGGFQQLKISGVQSLRLLGLAWNPSA